MGYAVQLYFDPGLETALLAVRAALTKAGVTPVLERLGDRPHVSLAVLNDVEIKRCIPMLERFANEQPAFQTSFAAFGAFPTTQGVVYLSPTPNEQLFHAHRVVNERLRDIGAVVHEHYLPDGWIPHTAIGFELSADEVKLALSWLYGNLKPVEGTFHSVGIIEFRPVKEWVTFPLCGPAIASTPMRASATRAAEVGK